MAKENLTINGVKTCILKLNRIKPIDDRAVLIAKRFKNVFFFEEGMLAGGIGESFNYKLSGVDFKGKFYLTAIEDKFISQATVDATLHRLNLDAAGMEKIITQRVGCGVKQKKTGCNAV